MAKFLVTYWKTPVGSGTESVWCGHLICEAKDEMAAQEIAERAKSVFEEGVHEQAHADWICRAMGRGGHDDGGDEDDEYPTSFVVKPHVLAVSELEWTESDLLRELAAAHKAQRERGGE